MVLSPEIQVGDLSFVPYLSQSDIQARISELGAHISLDFEGKVPVFIPVLNGAFMFAADLLKKITVPCELSFVKVASYHGAQSSGEVDEILGLTVDIRDRHVILVEDIVDTGLTMDQILKNFKQFQPASLSVASLFVKPDALKVDVPIAYRGFDIENKFIVGYGLDYNGLGRNLPDVYQKA